MQILYLVLPVLLLFVLPKLMGGLDPESQKVSSKCISQLSHIERFPPTTITVCNNNMHIISYYYSGTSLLRTPWALIVVLVTEVSSYQRSLNSLQY